MKAYRFGAIFLSVILLSLTPLYADMADYTFVQSTGTYTEITGGFSLGTETTDDQRFFDPANLTGTTTSPFVGPGFPIGFNFVLNDFIFDVLAVNANGWISLGQSSLGTAAVNITSTSSYAPLGSTSVITPVQLYHRIAGFARDIQAQVGATLRIETIGTAPNRICIVQWKNYKRYGTTGTGDILNFQIQLHETSNKVSVAFGAFTHGATTATAYPQVGMRGSDVTDFANRTTTDNWSATTPGLVVTATCAFTPTCVPLDGLIFDYLAPVPAVNDLQALSVTGTTTPSVGAASNYTITVRNRGSAAQTTYTVKLMLGTTEVGSVPGPAIASMEFLDVTIPWTPAAVGDYTLTGKVVLAGDENPLNDESSPFSVTVYPQGSMMVIIGSGASAQRYPLGSSYGYERSGSLYTLAELGSPGLITGIQWDCAVQYGNTVPYRILMKNTTDTAFIQEPWATTITDAQLCSEGTMTFDQTGWVFFPLTIPFLYIGDNLMVLVETNYGGTGTTSSQTFRYTTSATASHHYMYAENTPPTTNGYLSASRPNVGILFTTAGMGSLSGLVSSGGNPLEGANIVIETTPLNQLTNTAGTYSFPYVSAGTYNVTCTKLGYMTQTQQAVITAGQSTTLNFVMLPAPNVNVTGIVVGSDAPTVGLADATVNLTGVINYTGTTNASGQFTIPGVMAGNTYNYLISCAGYQNGTGSITIGATDYNMGTIILSELTSPPVGINAVLNTAETEVTITWSPPGATGPGYFFDFEIDNGGWVKSSNWTGTALPNYPDGDWEWTNTYDVTLYDPSGSTSAQNPPQTAHSGTGMWGTVIYGAFTNVTVSGQRSFLRQTFDLSGMQDPVLNLWHYMDGFNTWDYGQILVNGTVVWGTSSQAVFMPWQVLNIDLSAYENMSSVQVSFEWSATTVVNYSGWYIDDVYIGPATGVPTARSVASIAHPQITPVNNDRDRALLGYKVWRLLQGQETNEASWVSLTPTLVTDTFYVNTGYQSWPDGNYKWAVKSVYTGDVLSNPNFSNIVMKRPNDLSALTITGELNPSIGSASNYTVQIRNTGTSLQTAGSYTVKIMIGTNEVASVAGPAIAPGEFLDVIVPWIPATSGAILIYGKVVLPGDTLPDNDSTPPLEVFVFPEGTQMVIIGEGTSALRYPLGSLYGHERDAVIYTEDLFNGIVGRITGVQWYVHAQYGNTVPYKIYLKNTTATSLVAQPWANYIADATLMVEGTHTFNTLGWNYFPFPDSSQFVYLGGNLMVLTETNYGGTGTTSTQTFRYTTGPTACHHYNYQENTPPTGNGYTTTSRPNIGITFTSAGTEPQFNVTPTYHAFGTVLINTTHNRTINITNIGGGATPLVINSINITGSPFFTLQNLPTLPLSLSSFQSAPFVASYSPTTPGTHTATIVITDNLARTYTYRIAQEGDSRSEHPVPLSGTAIDVTIYALPYAQNFDEVTVPALPPDWNSIVIQTTTNGYVRTVTTTPYSAPNCVALYNGTDAGAQIALIAPPLDVSIPINASRIRFWLRAGGTGYTCKVGIMSDMTDPNTFTEIASLTPTSTWTEHVVGFQTYAGTGRFIVIKHGMGGTGRTIYVDNVMIEVIADNDLAAVSLTGNESPSVGNPYTYTVTVKNWGTLAQNNYQVKLVDQNNLELASVAGPAIDPDMTVYVDVPWTPSVSGAYEVYGKVVLAGDQNNLNDTTPPMSIYVHPAGTQMVTIGTGTSALRYPLGSLYGHERDAVIYTEDLFGGVVGRITGVQWYVHVQHGNTVPYKIYLKNTTATSLVAQPWANYIADATLMVEGTHTFNTLGWNYFPFPDSSNFVYLGGNLMVLTETNYGGTGTTSTQTFRYTTGPTACHHYNYAENNPPTGNGYTTTSRPNIGISFASIGTEPVFAIAPSSHNFGQTFMNTIRDKTFNITNIGGGTTPLVITNIAITGSPFFTLQNLPTLPATLGGFQSTNFVARYNPTAIGTHTATITVTDNLARTYTYRVGGRDGDIRTEHPVPLTAECIDPTIYTSPYVQNFDSVTVPNLPIDWTSYAVSPGVVVTYATSPHSAPNSVRIFNGASTEGPYLISPPISPTMPVNTMRIKLWAKGVATYVLSVGVMTNPYDVSTFVHVSSFNLTSAWAEYEVGLQTYTGTGQFIAIKHGNAATTQTIYVDDVTIEVIPDNDLAAVSITGNVTPSVGMSSTYTINIFNEGTLAQNDYQVKLMGAGDVELASIAGPAINPGTPAQVQLSWAPTTPGGTYIYGKVVLTGDQNALNNQTPNLNVLVQDAGTMVVTVGDGSQTSYYMPVNMYYKSSLYENIYFQSELNFIGLITGIGFYNNFLTNLPNKPTKVWLGTTTQTDLSAGWIHSTNMTLVFDGNVDYPSGQNLITIPLLEPFLYLEDNLVMMVNRPLDAVYYSSSDVFFCQTEGTNRARRINSDTIEYDPTTITGGTLTGQFPKTSLYVIPGGVGHLTGTVFGAGDLPLPNATVQITGGAQTTTNAQGQYTIMNIIDGTYEVTASRYGYLPQTLNVLIPEDSTVVQNFTLTQMPTVTVTGTIVGSDEPTVGLAGAMMTLSGYEDYSVTANAQGQFTIPGVYTNQTYQYQASAVGYQVATGNVTIGTTNHDMGTIIVSEIAYTPRNVSAVLVANQQSVTLTWQAPDPNAVDITEGFENPTFPPDEWSQIITNNGPPNAAGVYPTWSRFGTVVDGITTISPSEGLWQAGFWWNYNHQDEWLISPQFNCPQGASLTFDTYCYRGSVNNDHYYVKVTNNNGNTWTVLWDATALTGGYNVYQTPVLIDLSAYAGQQIKIAWHADDPNSTSDGMWYNWFIDNVVIGNVVNTIRFPASEMTVKSAALDNPVALTAYSNLPLSRDGSRPEASNFKDTGKNRSGATLRHSERAILGYKVWRLMQGQEQNEVTWTSLTPNLITDLTLTDTGWVTLVPGTYKWAVKAVYTNDVLSLAAFSNPLIKVPVPMGTLVGLVKNVANLPIIGAVINAGGYTTTSAVNGSYNMQVAIGTYAVTCSSPGYQTMVNENVVINQDQTTISNFTLPVSIDDEVQIAQTALKGNYPNPFNPETTISYDVKGSQQVKIEIYNTKGQLIRTLVDEIKATGHHSVVWDGRDNHGSPVASGVYHYRMRAGSYKANRLMMLLK